MARKGGKMEEPVQKDMKLYWYNGDRWRMFEEDEAVSRRGVVKMTAFWLFFLLVSSFPFLSWWEEDTVRFRSDYLYPNAWSWFLAHKVWTFWSDVYAMWIFKSFFLPLVKDMPIARSAWLVNSSTYFVCILVAINPDHQVHGQTRKVKNYWILVMGVWQACSPNQDS